MTAIGLQSKSLVVNGAQLAVTLTAIVMNSFTVDDVAVRSHLPKNHVHDVWCDCTIRYSHAENV